MPRFDFSDLTISGKSINFNKFDIRLLEMSRAKAEFGRIYLSRKPMRSGMSFYLLIISFVMHVDFSKFLDCMNLVF